MYRGILIVLQSGHELTWLHPQVQWIRFCIMPMQNNWILCDSLLGPWTESHRLQRSIGDSFSSWLYLYDVLQRWRSLTDKKIVWIKFFFFYMKKFLFFIMIQLFYNADAASTFLLKNRGVERTTWFFPHLCQFSAPKPLFEGRCGKFSANLSTPRLCRMRGWGRQSLPLRGPLPLRPEG